MCVMETEFDELQFIKKIPIASVAFVCDKRALQWFSGSPRAPFPPLAGRSWVWVFSTFMTCRHESLFLFQSGSYYLLGLPSPPAIETRIGQVSG